MKLLSATVPSRSLYRKLRAQALQNGHAIGYTNATPAIPLDAPYTVESEVARISTAQLPMFASEHKVAIPSDSEIDTQAVILSALRYLAARCDGAQEQDGVGYSKPDSWLGKRLAGREYLTASEVSQALAMLRKYAKSQLADAGITLPDEDTAKRQATNKNTACGKIAITPNRQGVTISFEYNAALVDVVKSLPGRKFNADTKTWYVPLAGAQLAADKLPDFAIDAATLDAIAAYVPEQTESDTPKYTGKALLDGKNIVVTFDYDAPLIAKLKGELGAKAKKDKDGNWYWPISVKQAAELLAVLPDTFFVHEAVQDLAKSQLVNPEMDAAYTETLLRRVQDTLPNGRTLFSHQKDGVEFVLRGRKVILADDMGLGKTMQALVAAKAYQLPVIVICPASLLMNWQREAEGVGVAIQVYSWAKIPAAPANDFVLIVDEAHYAQNIDAKRTEAMLTLAEDSHCKALTLLTGTPIKNGRPCNLYPLLVAVNHPIARNRRAYEAYYCDGKATRFTSWDVSGAAHLDELHTNTKNVMLRRLKKDCLDLPPKTRAIRSVELSKSAQAVYDARFAELRNEYYTRLAAGEIKTGGEALVMLNHVRHAGSVAKVETAIELAQEVIEQGQSVVVFTAFEASGETIATALNVKLFAGDTPTATRQAMVDDFQAHKTNAFVATLGAGNVGITLTAAQTVILVDRPWTPGDAEQAEDRLNRIGQTNAVTALWLQCGEVDETVDGIIQAKAERIELVLHGKRKTLRGVNMDAHEVLQAIF